MIHKMIIITLMITYVGLVRCDVNENEKSVNLTDFVKRAEKKFSDDDMVKLRNDLAKIYQEQADLNTGSYFYSDFKFLTDDKIVKMKNFKLKFFDIENHLNLDDSCAGKCETYQNVKYNANGCSGSVRGCVTSNIDVTVILQNPRKDRIYTELTTSDQCFFCDSLFYRSGNKIQMVAGLGWVSACGVCSCTCDQHGSEETMRRFYVGRIEAPPEYVVTGVRFVEHNRAIFLQIQIGKMVTLGLIDQDSVKWQDLPNDTADNQYFSLTYDYDSVILNPAMCPDTDGVITGFVFEKHEHGVRLRTIRKQITNPFSGQLANEAWDLGECYTTTKASVKLITDKIPNLNKKSPISSEYMIVMKLTGFRFGTSNFENDLGQSSIPYFDGSDVTFTVKVPLSHIEFIHYTNDENYAGFILPVLRPLNWNSKYM